MPEVLFLDPDEIKIERVLRVDLGDLDGLVESIRLEGQLQPIIVTKEDFELKLISGHRRLEACRKLGQKVAAVLVQASDAADVLWLQMVDNFRRERASVSELGEVLGRFRSCHPEMTNKEIKDRAIKELGISKNIADEAMTFATDLDWHQRNRLAKIEDPMERRRAERRILTRLKNKRRRDRDARKAGNKKVVGGRLDEGDYEEIIERYKEEGLWFGVAVIDIDEEHLDFRQVLNTGKLGIDWLPKIKPVLCDDATILAFTPAELVGVHVLYFQKHGFEYQGHIVWHITTPKPKQRKGWVPATMCIVWATQGKPYFDKQWDAKSEFLQNVYRCRLPHQHERLGHPEQKPRRLVERLLERHANESQNVLDPFMGVGTVPDACHKRGVWFAGIERDHDYFEAASNRLKIVVDKRKRGPGKGNAEHFKGKK